MESSTVVIDREHRLARINRLREQVSRRQRDVTETANRLSSAQEHEYHINVELEQTKMQLKSLQKDFEQKKHERNEKSKLLKELELKKKQLRDRKSKLVNQRIETEARKNSLEQQINNMHFKIKIQEDKILALYEELKELDKIIYSPAPEPICKLVPSSTYFNHMNQVNTLYRNTITNEYEIKNHEVKVKKAQDEKKELLAKLHQIEAELHQYRDTLSHLNSQLAAAKADCEQLKINIAHCESDIKQIEAKYKEEARQFSQLYEELLSLETELKMTESRYERLCHDREDISLQVDRLQQQLITAQHELGEIQNQLSRVESENSSLYGHGHNNVYSDRSSPSNFDAPPPLDFGNYGPAGNNNNSPSYSNPNTSRPRMDEGYTYPSNSNSNSSSNSNTNSSGHSFGKGGENGPMHLPNITHRSATNSLNNGWPPPPEISFPGPRGEKDHSAPPPLTFSESNNFGAERNSPPPLVFDSPNLGESHANPPPPLDFNTYNGPDDYLQEALNRSLHHQYELSPQNPYGFFAPSNHSYSATGERFGAQAARDPIGPIVQSQTVSSEAPNYSHPDERHDYQPNIVSKMTTVVENFGELAINNLTGKLQNELAKYNANLAKKVGLDLVDNAANRLDSFKEDIYEAPTQPIEAAPSRIEEFNNRLKDIKKRIDSAREIAKPLEGLMADYEGKHADVVNGVRYVNQEAAAKPLGTVSKMIGLFESVKEKGVVATVKETVNNEITGHLKKNFLPK